MRVVDHVVLVEAAADRASARRHVDDARPKRIGGLLEEWREDFGDAHGTDDVGVKAGVHALSGSFACVGYGCVVDDHLDVAMGRFGVFASVDDSAIVRDVDLDQFDRARQTI